MICFSATPGPEGQTITSIHTVYDMLLCDPGTGGTGKKSDKNKREKAKEKEETETKTQSGRQLPLSTLYMICFSVTPGPEGQMMLI